MTYSIQFATKTDTGLVRSGNEDAFSVDDRLGLVLVADGMGGYSAGEVASQLAVDVIQAQFATQDGEEVTIDSSLDCAQRSMDVANLTIAEAAAAAPEKAGMGTTMVLGRFLPTDLVYAWVGDSRLYRLREGGLDRLTSDHTLVQELVDQGMFESVQEAMMAGIGNNVLTRALGTTEPVPVSDGCTELAAGDLYLFCTDGLNHMVGDEEILRALVADDRDLDEKAQRLVELAYEQGGQDNITVVLAQIGVDADAAGDEAEAGNAPGR